MVSVWSLVNEAVVINQSGVLKYANKLLDVMTLINHFFIAVWNVYAPLYDIAGMIILSDYLFDYIINYTIFKISFCAIAQIWN